MRGLSQATDTQTGAPSLEDLQQRLDQLKAQQNKRKRESQHTAVQRLDSQPAPPAQDFAGTWELVSSTDDGVVQKFSPTRITITQDGPVVTLGHQAHRLTSSNTITYRMYYAHGQQRSYSVQTREEADLVDTFTMKLHGPMLVIEVLLDFQNANFGHPPGKELHVRMYRRVTPQQSSPDVQGQTTSAEYPDSQGSPSPQSFAGTWELVNSSFNGVVHEPKPMRLSITQNGSVVRIGNEEHRLTSPNTVTFQQYYVHDDRYGHQVQVASQADLIDTMIFRVTGSRLVAQTINYCRSNYYGCPAGRKTVLLREFRRVAEPAHAGVRTPPHLDARSTGSLLDYYPAASRRAGETGTAEVQVCVSPDGTPTSARILTSSGFKNLDAAAIKFFREARFHPATEDGNAVAACVTQPATFKLPQ
ncbi:MAG: energy transducer TonB [Steroidobacteraceae bacterium]